MVPFIKELGYSGKCDMLSAIHTDQMHQPWRAFSAIINRYISGKSTGLDRLKEFRDQILWGLFYKKNVDFVALQWENFMFQSDNKDISLARKENMPYPKFTQVIISHFISKDKTISMRNKINLHIIQDDSLLGTLKFQAKTSKKSSTVKTTGAVIRDTPGVSVLKKKEPAKDTHMLHGSGLGDGVGSQPKVPDEHQNKITSTNEGTGIIPGVFDVSKYQSESKNESWGDSNDDSNNDNNDYNDNNDDSDDNGGDDDKEEYEEDYEEEYVHTLENYEFSDDEEEYEELYGDVNVRMKDVEHEEEGKKDVENTKIGHDNVTQEKIYDQVEDDAHVTLTQKTEDKDKDEDPPPWTKDVEPSTGSKSKESKSRSSKGTKSQPKSSGKSTQVEEPVFEEYPFDLSKPLPLIKDRGRQVVPVDYFINNDLEYLKGGSSSRKYTTPITKSKAAKRIFILKRVEDLQLGVESYQKNLNITRPETFRTVLHDIAFNLNIDYLPKRRWSNLDRKRSRIMIKAIDQQLFKMRLMRNLKKF
nr:hypothetical protein [Tanacetum cinerariifolium]